MPAPPTTGVRPRGPASESLQGKKPRAIEASLLGRADLWGFEQRSNHRGGPAAINVATRDIGGRVSMRGDGVGRRCRDTIGGKIGYGGAHCRVRRGADESDRWRRSSGAAADHSDDHDVSVPTGSVVKARGWAPREKTSTTRMRPPQQGQVEWTTGASPSLAAAAR